MKKTLIERLYFGGTSVPEAIKLTERYVQLSEIAANVCEQLKDFLNEAGQNLLEKLENIFDDREAEISYRNYYEGFVAGVRLTMEILEHSD